MKENAILTLENNKKYVVVNHIILDHLEYLYLGNIDDHTDFMFCKLEGLKLSKVIDLNIIRKLIKKLEQ